MNLTTPATAPTMTVQPQKMPWLALVLLASMGFMLIAAETMPAGLLPVIAGALGASEGMIGQFISVWALGTVIVTVPAISLTRGLRRKPLTLTVIAGLILANTITAVSSDIPLSLISRFVAGACTGILWGMLAAGTLGAVLIAHFSALVLAALMAALGAVALALTLYGLRAAFTNAP